MGQSISNWWVSVKDTWGFTVVILQGFYKLENLQQQKTHKYFNPLGKVPSARWHKNYLPFKPRGLPLIFLLSPFLLVTFISLAWAAGGQRWWVQLDSVHPRCWVEAQWGGRGGGKDMEFSVRWWYPLESYPGGAWRIRVSRMRETKTWHPGR